MDKQVTDHYPVCVESWKMFSMYFEGLLLLKCEALTKFLVMIL